MELQSSRNRSVEHEGLQTAFPLPGFSDAIAGLDFGPSDDRALPSPTIWRRRGWRRPARLIDLERRARFGRLDHAVRI